ASSAGLALQSGLEAREFGAACLRLRRQGWIDGAERAGETRCLRAIERAVLGVEALRAAHARRADRIASLANGENRELGAARVALHRFCARPHEGTVGPLVQALATLRERGRAEASLALIDRARHASALLGVDFAQAAPELFVERARAWCSL